jgi:hypothetical protein
MIRLRASLLLTNSLNGNLLTFHLNRSSNCFIHTTNALWPSKDAAKSSAMSQDGDPDEDNSDASTSAQCLHISRTQPNSLLGSMKRGDWHQARKALNDGTDTALRTAANRLSYTRFVQSNESSEFIAELWDAFIACKADMSTRHLRGFALSFDFSNDVQRMQQLAQQLSDIKLKMPVISSSKCLHHY